jgi:hypothetical protein
MASALLLTICGAPLALRAQSDESPNPNKVLIIQREFTKPGRDGASHQATEAAYVRAAAAGKAPFHYVAVTSITGPNRALFLSAYPSFAAVEQERKSVGATLGASLDRTMVADGDVLSSQDASAWVVRPELSTNIQGMRVGSRYLIAREYVIKPGHQEEWKNVVKMVKDGYAKAVPEAHWTMYQMAFGHSTAPTYLILTAVKSMDEVDAMFDPNSKFEEAVGADGLKRLDELTASCVESEMSNVFVVDPKMSIPTDEMIKAEPDFWRPKTASGVAKKSAAAKSTASGQ